MIRLLRTGLLLLILLGVGLSAWRVKHKVAEWRYPLRAVVYPINGDGSAAAGDYMATLDADAFDPIVAFVAAEADRRGVKTEYGAPVEIALAPAAASQPPAPPPDRNPLRVIAWSLHLRWWAWRADTYKGPSPDIRIFVRYFDPATHDTLAHSLGLEKGMLGVVNAYASRGMAPTNNVIIAHELLHTVGATDKYDPATGLPRYPEGYGEPDRIPRHPQQLAEIMGGRIAVSDTRADIPVSLRSAVIGVETAREIQWLR